MKFKAATPAATSTQVFAVLITLVSLAYSKNRISRHRYYDDRLDENTEDEPFECGIYLAPSSIKNAGYGLYTTRDIKRDEYVQTYPEAPSIVVTDFYKPNGNLEADWNHVDYIWEANSVAAFEAMENSESVMTFGSLCNYHPVSLDVLIMFTFFNFSSRSIFSHSRTPSFAHSIAPQESFSTCYN